MNDIEAFKKGISLRPGDKVDGVEIFQRAVDPSSGVFGFQMRGGGFLSLANAIGKLRPHPSESTVRAKAWLEARVAEMSKRHIEAQKRGCAPNVVGELGAKWAEACQCANDVSAILDGKEPSYAPPGFLAVVLAPVPRGHCGRCDRCGWEFSADPCTCYPNNCSMRPLPAKRKTCAGCGAPFEWKVYQYCVMHGHWETVHESDDMQITENADGSLTCANSGGKSTFEQGAWRVGILRVGILPQNQSET